MQIKFRNKDERQQQLKLEAALSAFEELLCATSYSRLKVKAPLHSARASSEHGDRYSLSSQMGAEGPVQE